MVTDTGSDDGADSDLPPTVLDDLVAAPRRRRMLQHLAERDEPVALTDLATAVGAEEAGTREADVSQSVRRSVREDIYEHHLPKLTATGVVEFDSMRGTVSLSATAVRDRVT